MPGERENCISCRKKMGEMSSKTYLDYRNSEWQIARNHIYTGACNWCYWYAWDNVSRVSPFQNLGRMTQCENLN